MSSFDGKPAKQPTFYFIGVTTGKSSIMRVFPKWVEYLKLGVCRIVGIDCKWHDDPEVYRRVVKFIKEDPFSLGALVTTHKIDLLNAARDLFDDLDPYAELLGEISGISKCGGKLCGHAKDPITSGLSLEAFIPRDHWRATHAEVCVLGAGGSSLALTAYFMKDKPKEERPSAIYVTNRSAARLEFMEKLHQKINPGIKMEYHLCSHVENNDAVVKRLKPGSLIINATGLGKDASGSPLSNAVEFPQDGYVWDFNYRGELAFLDQARIHKTEKNLTIEDGWEYFLYGWTQVMREVFHMDMPTAGPVFKRLSEIAAAAKT